MAIFLDARSNLSAIHSLIWTFAFAFSFREISKRLGIWRWIPGCAASEKTARSEVVRRMR